MLLIYKCLCHALVLLLIEERRRTLIKVEWSFAPMASIRFAEFDHRVNPTSVLITHAFSSSD